MTNISVNTKVSDLKENQLASVIMTYGGIAYALQPHTFEKVEHKEAVILEKENFNKNQPKAPGSAHVNYFNQFVEELKSRYPESAIKTGHKMITAHIIAYTCELYGYHIAEGVS